MCCVHVRFSATYLLHHAYVLKVKTQDHYGALKS